MFETVFKCRLGPIVPSEKLFGPLFEGEAWVCQTKEETLRVPPDLPRPFGWIGIFG